MPVLDFIAWVLLVIWASLLAGGYLFRRARTRRRLLPPWVQAASAVTLLLLAWYGYLLTRAGTDTASYAFGIAAAITLNLVGGQLAAGAVASRRTLSGISAIAVGHLLYAAAMAQYGAALGGVRLLALSLWLLVGALAAGTVLLRTRLRRPLPELAAAAYTLMLFAAAGFATGLALTAPRFGVLAAGALLLLSCDLILLVELAACSSLFPSSRTFGESEKGWLLPSISSAARLLRAPGQALVVVSIWSALQNPANWQF